MKILITLLGSDVAPRFDLTTEVLLVNAEAGKVVGKPKTILLPRASAEELCSLLLKEDVNCLICGGIEESHYEYVLWKKVRVIDKVIGPYARALELALANQLESGAILLQDGNGSGGSAEG